MKRSHTAAIRRLLSHMCLSYFNVRYLPGKRRSKTALNYAMRSLELAQQYGLKEQISDANLKLSELYEKAGNKDRSLKYYKNYIVYRDSVNDIKSVQKMADLRTDYEVSQKQVEVDLLNQQTRNQKIINLSLFIILGLATVILGNIILVLQNNFKREKEIRKFASQHSAR